MKTLNEIMFDRPEPKHKCQGYACGDFGEAVYVNRFDSDTGETKKMLQYLCPKHINIAKKEGVL